MQMEMDLAMLYNKLLETSVGTLIPLPLLAIFSDYF